MSVGQKAFGEHVARIAHQIAVAEHHALGAAGRAAGVEDAGEIVAAAPRVGHRRGARRSVLVVGARRGPVGRSVVGIDQRQSGSPLQPMSRRWRRKPCRRPERSARQSRSASSFSSALQRMLSGTMTAPAQAIAR